MKLIYQIDRCICGSLRKLHLPFYFIDRKNVIQRYVKRNFSDIYDKYNQPYTSSKIKCKDIVWIFWWQGEDEMPPLVKRCYQQILKMANEYEVHLLTKNNYAQFIEIPQYIISKVKLKQISITIFSDLLRFSLLWKYGGWWMDATIYPIHPLPHKIEFYTIKIQQDDKYISKGLWSSFLWYLPPKHPMAGFLMSCWHKYWKENNKLIEYFLTDHFLKLFYDSSIEFKRKIDSLTIDNPDLYFFQSKKAMNTFNLTEWNKIKSENMFFKLNWRCNLNTFKEGSFLKYVLFDKIDKST